MSPSYIEMENRVMVTRHKELAIIGDGGKKVLVTQLCSTLCDPLDCSPPGSSIHGISQARILKWVAIFFSESSIKFAF